MINKRKNNKPNITILGSTGSIGRQTLEVVENLGYNVYSLCVNNSIKLLEEQVRKFKPVFAVVYDEKAAGDLKIRIRDTDTTVLCGMNGIISAATDNGTDFVLNSMMGKIGIVPTLEAIGAKKTIGLANKETLVAAGDIIMSAAKENKVKIFPVDSEHSAIYQSMKNEDSRKVDRILLTASGGPFYGRTREELQNVTISDTLNHPTWTMGRKITVDSATMMNKGLELIEAYHLFGIAPDNIDIIIHRESIIHSIVEFADNSQIAQLSVPDMKLCIQYALTGENRQKSLTKKLDLTEVKLLTFKKPDDENFPLAKFARDMIKKGGIMPCIMNSYNEIAVELFLNEKIKFHEIHDFVINNTLKHNNIENPNIEDILNIQGEIQKI